MQESWKEPVGYIIAEVVTNEGNNQYKKRKEKQLKMVERNRSWIREGGNEEEKRKEVHVEATITEMKRKAQ